MPEAIPMLQAHLRRPMLDLDAVVEGVDADGSGLIDAWTATKMIKDASWDQG